MRNAVTVAGGVVLSFLLLASSVVVVGHFTRGGQLNKDRSTLSEGYSSVRAKYGDPWQLMSQTVHLYEFGVQPAIALIVGGLVGLFSKRREVVLGCITALPLALFALAALSLSAMAFSLAGSYVLLAAFGAYVVRAYKNRRTTAGMTKPTG